MITLNLCVTVLLQLFLFYVEKEFSNDFLCHKIKFIYSINQRQVIMLGLENYQNQNFQTTRGGMIRNGDSA